MIIIIQRWFLILLCLLSPAIPLEAYFRGNWDSFFDSYSLGIFFGIISYVWFANTLIISARFRFFNRLFGQDRVMVFHGYLAAMALTCAFTHAIFKNMYFDFEGGQVKLGFFAIILFTAVAFASALLMVKSFIHRINFLNKFRKFCQTRIGFDYSRLKLFHNITAIAMILIIIHVLLAFSTSETTYRLLLTGIWGGVSLIVYVYHKFFRFFWRKRHALAVNDVEMLSEDIFCISAGSDKFKPTHRAGQFGYLRFFSPHCGIEEHPFTIASAPESETLDIVIKDLGDYTGKLKNITPGAKLVFDGPYGIFTPELNANPYLFIAGGIGITPFLSIISEWSKSELTKPVTLVWSVKSEDDLVDQGLFDRLTEQQKNFRYIKVLTRSAEGESKRINRELLGKILKSDRMDNPHAYLCGPDAFQKDISHLLRKLGLARRNLHFESFGN